MSFTPLLLQRGLGVSVLGSAAVLAAWSGTSTAVALATRRLFGRRSAAAVVVLGFAVSAAGEFALAGLGVGSSWTRLLPGLVILGIGSGFVNASLGRLALESVPRDRAGMAAEPTTPPAIWAGRPAWRSWSRSPPAAAREEGVGCSPAGIRPSSCAARCVSWRR